MLIKNCFNYVGSKERIFSLIDENLNKDKKYFCDVFCGGGAVGINELLNYEKVTLNDICWQLIETMKFLRDSDWEVIIEEIESYINEFELSKENKEGYLKLRDLYNSNYTSKETFSPSVFYTLVAHSFNNLIGANKSDEFNVPFGKGRSSFNDSLRTKLKNVHNILSRNKSKLSIVSLDFTKLIKENSEIIPDTMFYLDPPYLASDSSYNRVYYAKWDGTKERKLYETLDYINDKGGSFLLSNVTENNGTKNEVLIEWSKKYTVIDVTSDYSNCNYQRKNLGNTREVLVKNY